MVGSLKKTNISDEYMIFRTVLHPGTKICVFYEMHLFGYHSQNSSIAHDGISWWISTEIVNLYFPTTASKNYNHIQPYQI